MIKKRHCENGIMSNAIYSDCGNYRYVLTREWDESKKRVMFIALNPSTATELKNDPTVARIMNYAKDWGYGGASVCNVFGYRATDPKNMKAQKYPTGPDNDSLILEEAKNCDKVIACWGNHALHMNRARELRPKLGELYCLGTNSNGEPKHPLYLKKNLIPKKLE